MSCFTLSDEKAGRAGANIIFMFPNRPIKDQLNCSGGKKSRSMGENLKLLFDYSNNSFSSCNISSDAFP